MDNYGTLQASVISWMNRDDLVTLVPDFIKIALQQANRDLKLLDMESFGTFALSETTVEYALPTDYLSMRSIYIDSDPTKPHKIPHTKLVYVTPQQLSLQESPNSSVGPNTYTIAHGKIILDTFGETGSARKLHIEYFAQYAVLVNSTDTNWLIDNAYDVLLYGALLAAEGWLQTDERLVTWNSQYDKAIESLNNSAESGRFSGDALRIRAV